MKLKKIFLLSLLVLLLVGVSYATEANNDTISTADALEVVKDTSTTTNIVDNSINEESEKDKEITKNIENKTIKMASKSYSVTNFDTLHSALTNGEYSTVTLNIKSNIKLAGDTTLNEAITKLTINGNGKTINGNDKYQFLKIDSSYRSVNIYNLKITNCNGEDGGVIYNNGDWEDWPGPLVISNSTFNNNKADGGSVIYNYYGNLIINNSAFSNNTAGSGGAIYNYGGTLNIINSTFSNNTVEGYGGAIYSYWGILTISNSTLQNNKATPTTGFEAGRGGAIYNNVGTLTIINTTLQNNKATLTSSYEDAKGGAIYNDWGTLSISNSTLQDNTVNGKGAIYNDKGTLTVINSTFSNNTSTDDGGAICNWDGTLTITNSTLQDNTAYNGGAICNWEGTVTISNSTLQNNKATSSGGAIYNKANMLVDNNIFITNKANTTGKIIIDMAEATIENNTNDEIYKYSSTIYTDGDEVTIINNIFDNRKDMTILTINKIANVKLNNSVTVTGILTDDTGITLSDSTVNIKINAKSVNIKTNSEGVYEYTTKTTIVGLNNVTVTYKGDNNYLASSNKTTFRVKQPTWIKMASFSNVEYGSTVKLVGRLLNGTSAVKYVPVNVTVNGKTYKVKTDGAGYIRLNYTVNSYDNQKVTFKFAGNTLYAASSNSTTFKVKQPTWIKMANMANVKYGSTVKLVGRLLYNGTTAVKYTLVNVTVNSKTYKVKTDGAGYIRLNYTVNNYNDQKVTFKFAGNNLYLASSNSTVFKVKQPTWIKHASVGKVKQGSTVQIVGRVLYNGTTAVKYVPVNVTVNGKVYNLKTDGAGYYRLNYTASTLGTITFTSKFGGNNLYLASTNSTKFTVVKS